MALNASDRVLTEAIWPATGAALWLKRAVLFVLGVAALAVMAKIKVPVPPSPVPVNMGTFAVLTIGAVYGPRLGLATILGYLLVGSLGYDVFANSSVTANGIGYMTGSTGGYLLGYVLAIAALGLLARRGWDRSVVLMALAMLIGNVLLYVPGLGWLAYWIGSAGKLDLAVYGSLTGQTFAWGITPYLIGDLLKLALAALLVPGLWKLVGNART